LKNTTHEEYLLIRRIFPSFISQFCLSSEVLIAIYSQERGGRGIEGGLLEREPKKKGGEEGRGERVLVAEMLRGCCDITVDSTTLLFYQTSKLRLGSS
jgi:hypothetical protein